MPRTTHCIPIISFNRFDLCWIVSGNRVFSLHRHYYCLEEDGPQSYWFTFMVQCQVRVRTGLEYTRYLSFPYVEARADILSQSEPVIPCLRSVWYLLATINNHVCMFCITLGFALVHCALARSVCVRTYIRFDAKIVCTLYRITTSK